MRTPVLIAAALVLATGCSPTSDIGSRPTALTPITKDGRTPTPATGTAPGTATGTATTPNPASATPDSAAPAPASDATTAQAVAWVEAAPPVDAADFAVALRGGATTPLGDDVAFTTPSGISCMTDVKRAAAGLACLVDLDDPPAQPPDTYGVWKGGWVDFDGASVKVGSAHGDPGRFAAGQGPPLPPGSSLSFGDFRCRTDSEVLICVNYARQTAARYADSGIDAYGCARQTPPAAGIGIEFSC